MKLKIALVAGLSDAKLSQKLRPLQALDAVERIDLYRRRPFHGEKIRWIPVPPGAVGLQELARAGRLLGGAGACDLIIGCHQFYHGVWAWLAGAVWRKPVIQIIITDVERVRRGSLAWRAVRAAVACGVRGPRSAERLRACGYAGAVEILHNVFEPPPDMGEVRRGRRFDLLVVGSHRPVKDYTWMLDIVVGVRESAPNVSVAVAGAGQSGLRRLVVRRGLENTVTLLGEQSPADILPLYSRARALLLTSRSEGLPMAAIEAMSRGLPVFAPAVGDLPWLVRNGVEGWLVAHGDTSGMRGAILEGLAAPERLAEAGRRARQRILELAPEFTPQAIGPRWERLLRACTSARACVPGGRPA